MIVEVEAILNNCPLTYVSSDAKDIEPITPSRLLLGVLPHYDVKSDELKWRDH